MSLLDLQDQAFLVMHLRLQLCLLAWYVIDDAVHTNKQGDIYQL